MLVGLLYLSLLLCPSMIIKPANLHLYTFNFSFRLDKFGTHVFYHRFELSKVGQFLHNIIEFFLLFHAIFASRHLALKLLPLVLIFLLCNFAFFVFVLLLHLRHVRSLPFLRDHWLPMIFDFIWLGVGKFLVSSTQFEEACFWRTRLMKLAHVHAGRVIYDG